MGRLEKLQDEIAKGLNGDKTGLLKGDIIDRWSPNNLRRICVSPKVIIVEYYVCDGKTKRLREIIPVEEAFKMEFARLSNDVDYRNKEYRGLLSCLVKTKVGKSPRSFSSIEEVIFFGDYPVELFKKDIELNILAHGSRKQLENGKEFQEAIKSRFRRLKCISLVNATEEQIIQSLNECRAFGTDVLSNLITKQGVAPLRNYVINQKDWWSGTFLRGTEYSMDIEGSKLSNYFRDNISKLNEAIEKENLDKKYEELKSKKEEKEKELSREDTLALYNSLNKMSNDFITLMTMCQDIFDYASKVDRGEWAGYLERDSIIKLCKNNLDNKNVIKNALEKLNIDALKEKLVEQNLDYSNISKVLHFIDVELGLVPRNVTTDGVDKKAFDKVFKWLLSVVSSIPYMALVKYSTKTGNRDKYVSFHLKKLALENLIYSEGLINFSNKNLKNTDARKSLALVTDSRLLDNNVVSVGVKISESMKILKALKAIIRRN